MKVKILNLVSLFVASCVVFGNNIFDVNAFPLTQPTNTKQTNNQSPPTHEANGIRYQFAGCQRSGEQLSCGVLLTSLQEDRTIQGFVDSQSFRLIDLEGNQYLPSTLQLSRNEKIIYGGLININLVQGVPLKVVLNFEKIPFNVKNAILLQFGRGQLRNITF